MRDREVNSFFLVKSFFFLSLGQMLCEYVTLPYILIFPEVPTYLLTLSLFPYTYIWQLERERGSNVHDTHDIHTSSQRGKGRKKEKKEIEKRLCLVPKP